MSRQGEAVSSRTSTGTARRVPGWLPVPAAVTASAVFHYLGPAFAVLLFARVEAAGVAWLRIASAAVVFAAWRRPWRTYGRATPAQRRTLLALGILLAAMNTMFYLAIDRLPLATVGAIEFLGVVVLAAVGARGGRNALALALAVGGVFTLTDVRFGGEPLGFVFAFANCALFMAYVVLGHRIANPGPADGPAGHGAGHRAPARSGPAPGGVDQVGAAMLIAAVVALPVGLGPAAPAFGHPALLLAGIGVGVCSSVIPYVTDQIAMRRLGRATFALTLSVLPASATVIGLLVLAQLPTVRDLAGIALVSAAIAVHRPPADRTGGRPAEPTDRPFDPPVDREET